MTYRFFRLFNTSRNYYPDVYASGSNTWKAEMSCIYKPGKKTERYGLGIDNRYITFYDPNAYGFYTNALKPGFSIGSHYLYMDIEASNRKP